MAKIRLIHDRIGETLTVYFEEPDPDQVCEETGEGIILIKNSKDRVIGFEKLYFQTKEPEETLTVETSISGLSRG